MAGRGSSNIDWSPSLIGDDADLWLNAYLLTAKMRDLFKSNPTYIKYRELLWANIFGENGIMLRMKIKETEDRVIHTPDEAGVDRLRASHQPDSGMGAKRKRAARRISRVQTRRRDGAHRARRHSGASRKAKIQVGDPDVFANPAHRARWPSGSEPSIATCAATEIIMSCASSASSMAFATATSFKRHIRDPKVNKFGYSLQIIGGEWCDRFYNARLDNGNVVIMGIEYEMSPWGLGKKVAYYFIKRQPNDWQFTCCRADSISPVADCTRRDSREEIVHYARPVDAEGTRPAPWVAAAFHRRASSTKPCSPKSSRGENPRAKPDSIIPTCCPKAAWSTICRTRPPDFAPNRAIPGTHARLEMGESNIRSATRPIRTRTSLSSGKRRAPCRRGYAAGDYNVLFNDLKNINFSAGRLGRLDTNEMSKMLQRFDIDTAERPIFEAWLEMALITGAIPLPFTKEKFAKFNKPLFQGRRWAQVDEVKAVNSAALAFANKFSSRNRECAEEGIDFEENAIELAEEEMLFIRCEEGMERGRRGSPSNYVQIRRRGGRA
jgi:hypothetical protein